MSKINVTINVEDFRYKPIYSDRRESFKVISVTNNTDIRCGGFTDKETVDAWIEKGYKVIIKTGK